MFGELDLDPVARQQPDPIPHTRSLRRRTCSVSQHLRLVSQLEPIQQTRQFLNDSGYHFHGRVRTQGPSGVIATQCSKWAE